jgi:hypothetical protein
MTTKLITLVLSAEHLHTARKALVKQLQRAKEKKDEPEAQRAKALLDLIDLKLEMV